MSNGKCHLRIMQLLPLTDEKLEEYLGVWERLVVRGQKGMLNITVTIDYKQFVYERYTLLFGEELRELTEDQALKVIQWLDRMA